MIALFLDLIKGGQYIPLRNANLLAKVIIILLDNFVMKFALIFIIYQVIVGGAVEEISLERLVEDAQKEIENQRVNFGITDESELAKVLHEKLKSKGMQTNQIKLNNSSIEKASEISIKYSKASNLSDLKSEFVKLQPEPHLSVSSSLRVKGVAPMYSASAAPMMMSFASAAPGAPVLELNSFEPKVDEYSIAREEVSYAQTERLVQKALNRKK